MTGQVNRVLWVFSLAVLLVGLAAPAAAQNGTLSGRVVDSERRVTDKFGQPVPGLGKMNPDNQLGLSAATVTLELKSDPPRQFKVATDAYGEWYKSGLPPGTYDISVRLEWVDRTDMSKSPKPVVFIASSTGVVVKPGEKRRLPDLPALTEEAVAAGRRPPVASSLSAAEADAENKRAAEEKNLLTGVDADIAAKKYGEAIVKLTEITTRRDKCGRCFVRMGEIELMRNDEKAAEAAFLKAIELDPANPDPYSQLAAIYNGLRRFDEAAKMGAKASELMGALGSTDPIAVYNQGVILWNAGNVEGAKAEFARAVKLDPKRPNAQYFLGMTTFVLASSGKGALIDAKAPLQEYLKLAPTGEYAANAKEFLASIK